MQSFIRGVNITLAPILTLAFSAKFEPDMGEKWGRVVAGSAAGLTVIAIELCVSLGPRYSRVLRRWLDPRSAFEGIWLQDIRQGQPGNDLAIFLFTYIPAKDTFAVHGHCYSANGQQWANWESTRLFFDDPGRKVTYLWKGALLGGRPTPDAEKAGLTELTLRVSGAMSLPIHGEGRVSHVLEATTVKFELRRVTREMLKDLGLPFSIRSLRDDAHDEEQQLARSYLASRPTRRLGEAAPPAVVGS